MQNAARMRQFAVHCTVDRNRGRVQAIIFVINIICVDPQQITGSHFRKMHPERIHQELPSIVRDRKTDVVGDALMQADACEPTERCGQFNPGLHLEIGRIQ